MRIHGHFHKLAKLYVSELLFSFIFCPPTFVFLQTIFFSYKAVLIMFGAISALLFIKIGLIMFGITSTLYSFIIYFCNQGPLLFTKSGAIRYIKIFLLFCAGLLILAFPVNIQRPSTNYQDKKAGTAIEPWCFSHVFYSPYLYIYGVSGYSKINVLPFVGHMDKVINSAYYDTVPKERIGGFENTLDYLQKQYDKDELSIKYHLDDMDEKDQEIFQQLKIFGKREDGRYFQQFYPKRWIKDGFNPNNIKQALDSL